MWNSICVSFIGILIILIGVVFNEAFMRWINYGLDKLLEKLKLRKVPASVFYVLWGIFLSSIVIIYSIVVRNSIIKGLCNKSDNEES